MKPKRLSRRMVYSHPWFNLYVDRVRFPGGRVVDDHHVLDFKIRAAGALVEDGRGRVLLIRSHRYVTGTVGWEIPAGVVEKGESILAGARREALEESGYDTAGHRLLYAFFPNHGISNIRFHVVRCRAAARRGGWDKDEVKGRRWFSKQEARRLLSRRAVLDSFSLVALLLWLQGFKKDKMRAARKGGF